MLRHASSISFTLLVASVFLGLCQLLHIHAQTFKPSGLPSPTNSYIDGQALFIAGGYFEYGGDSPTKQAFAIDLSVSWNTSKPIFKKLPDSPPFYYGPSTISADGKQWIVIDNITVYSYDIEKSKWSTLFRIPKFEPDFQIAVTDPETGLIYIPNTYIGFLIRLNIHSKTSENKQALGDYLSDATYYSAAWSASQRKLFFMGGFTYGVLNGKGGDGYQDQLTHFNMFSYDDKIGWTNLTRDAKGEIPPPRRSACLVSAYGGTKMVIFGGYTRDMLNALADIYILDVATMIWTRGPDIDQKERRAKPACAISNEHFIAWGGERDAGGNNELPRRPILNSTIVFNLKTNKWTSTYSAIPNTTTTKNATTTTSNTASPTGTTLEDSTRNSSGKLSVDAVISVIALGVGAIALSVGAFLLYHMHRKRIALQDQGPKHQDLSAPTKDDDDHFKAPPAYVLEREGPVGNPQCDTS
ncbi:hypothetical protein B0O80DRAFT_424350 [Mortierella sp. GBAus27b]|nr:hypothetical protein BGX31_003306 [Mortierella sp. GBA43]KAI8358287.1 hypothetical protein B0O80DRAFT_424350 [Mortierella sp. GBAus27b]